MKKVCLVKLGHEWKHCGKMLENKRSGDCVWSKCQLGLGSLFGQNQREETMVMENRDAFGVSRRISMKIREVEMKNGGGRLRLIDGCR